LDHKFASLDCLQLDFCNSTERWWNTDSFCDVRPAVAVELCWLESHSCCSLTSWLLLGSSICSGGPSLHLDWRAGCCWTWFSSLKPSYSGKHGCLSWSQGSSRATAAIGFTRSSPSSLSQSWFSHDVQHQKRCRRRLWSFRLHASFAWKSWQLIEFQWLLHASECLLFTALLSLRLSRCPI
jgi:hypothetical protein